MRAGNWLVLGLISGLVPILSAQETPDSLRVLQPVDSVNKESSIIYVIPAGPVAGSFTDESRIQIMDTVAGWARILVEGWVPVEHVVPRMAAEAPQYEFTEKEKPKKTKADRPQCIETTAKGKQCSRKAIAGGKRCWQHSQ